MPPRRKKTAKKRDSEDHIFVSLTPEAKGLLAAYMTRQRVRPTRAAVALAALIDWLKRDEHGTYSTHRV